jgi:hypothetical protein
MDQQAERTTSPTRDELRAQFFSPAAKARREAALSMLQQNVCAPFGTLPASGL